MKFINQKDEIMTGRDFRTNPGTGIYEPALAAIDSEISSKAGAVRKRPHLLDLLNSIKAVSGATSRHIYGQALVDHIALQRKKAEQWDEQQKRGPFAFAVFKGDEMVGIFPDPIPELDFIPDQVLALYA